MHHRPLRTSHRCACSPPWARPCIPGCASVMVSYFHHVSRGSPLPLCRSSFEAMFFKHLGLIFYCLSRCSRLCPTPLRKGNPFFCHPGGSIEAGNIVGFVFCVFFARLAFCTIGYIRLTAQSIPLPPPMADAAIAVCAYIIVSDCHNNLGVRYSFTTQLINQILHYNRPNIGFLAQTLKILLPVSSFILS